MTLAYLQLHCWIFYLFFKDYVALASLRTDDQHLQDVLANRVQADDSGKYTWLRSHRIIDWKEETWVARVTVRLSWLQGLMTFR